MFVLDQIFELSALALASVLISTLAVSRSSLKDWTVMPLSFVADFAALLLLGPGPATVVAAAGAITASLADPSSRRIVRILLNAASIVVAIQTAGAAYVGLGGTPGQFAWPAQSLPIAAAVLAYSVVRNALADIVVPLCTKRPLNRSWLKRLLAGCQSYCLGGTVAVALVELIDHRLWQLVVVVAVPIFFGCRAYCAYVRRLDEDRRRREIVDALDEGMCVVDHTGRITIWDDAIERILSCPRGRALGRSLVDAAPALRKTEVQRALDHVLTNRTPQTIARLFAGQQILEVRMLPVDGGVTLLWRDVTARTATEHALKRGEARFALAAEGANDGLWEWDLRTQKVYLSGRWRAMIGLAPRAGIGRLEEWMDRVHPDDVGPLKEALNAHIAGKTELFQHEHRIRHEDGAYRRFLCRGVAAKGSGRRASRIAGSLTDTTERAIAQERLRTAGFLDPLTGLCNRAVFVEAVGRRLDEFKQGRGAGRFAALYLDLDRFKVVNDSLGHLVGDELLKAVSRRLESCLRQGDSLARLGGDEFAILLNGLATEQQANAIAFRIQEALSTPFSIGGREVFTSASIGIAFGRAHYNNPDEIMRDADTAMYHAKSSGKARHELFDADMHARTLDRLGLENDLRRAISQRDLEVHYQPIVSLASGMCVGFESLVRWTRNGETISPATFVPIAEELGLIEPLGTWVLQQACATFARWQRQFPGRGLDCITVNVSSRQLMQPNFLNLVEQAVGNAGLKPCDLRLEITETALMDSPTVAAELLRELRDFGVKIYLDDFGTGYSSLSHLHRLPVDALKIDRSFVKSLLLPEHSAIVESILALARTLNTSVVAEGIESDVQARELQRLGCTHAQGYLFSRPLSREAAERMLEANQPLGPNAAAPSVQPSVTFADHPAAPAA